MALLPDARACGSGPIVGGGVASTQELEVCALRRVRVSNTTTPHERADTPRDRPIAAMLAGEPPSPPPPPPQRAVRPGGEIRAPAKVFDVAPVYPALARQARVQGVVIIEATIGIDGHVEQARVLRSIPLLDDAALTAVRQWRYTPTLLNGTPVPLVMTVTVNFELR